MPRIKWEILPLHKMTSPYDNEKEEQIEKQDEEEREEDENND